MADAEVNFALQAEDEYSGVFDELQSQIDGLAGTEIELGVSADSSGLDDVRSAVDDLAGISNIDIPIGVTGDAEETIEDISSDLAALDGADARLSVSADDQASDVLDQIGEKLDDLEVKASSFSDLLTAGFAGGIGGMVAGEGADLLDKVISAFTDMPAKAAESESATVRLQLAVEKSGISWASVSDQTEKYIDALMKATAIDDEKIKSTAASLLFMGMNYDTAMRTLVASLDLAAARQMDVESAAKLLGRAWQGNYSILERYGVVLDEQVKKSGDFMAALDVLSQKFGGTAVKMADTMTGEMNRAGNAWENFQEMVGGGINWLSKSLLGGLNWLFGQKPSEITMPTSPTASSTFKTYSYQKGGIVPWYSGGGGTLVRAAEKEAEAIIPLSKLEKMVLSWQAEPHIREGIREITETSLTEESRINLAELRKQLQETNKIIGHLQEGIREITKTSYGPLSEESRINLADLQRQLREMQRRVPHIREGIREITETSLTEESGTNLAELQRQLSKLQSQQTKTRMIGAGAPTWIGGRGASFFPTGPSRGELYPATPQPQTMQLNINVRGATMADLQFASEVGKELAKLNVLSGASRRWP